jgi:glycosyltransferase involved in cell wall biosynthesis
MRRVLVISYHFPPIGGAGAQRPAKLVRRLHELGWESTVVTGPAAVAGRWTPLDDELLSELPEGTRVLRVPGPEPAPNVAGWRHRAERWLGINAWRRWWIDGVVAAARSAEPVDLVYAWMAPFESATAAETIARSRGVPWVGDLGDPWALDEMWISATRLHARLARVEMRRRLGKADALVLSTREAATQMRAHVPELAGKPVVAIPNGFDADDFAAQVPPRRDGAFRIVHTGYLHTALGLRLRRHPRLRRLLGGAVRGLDVLPRSHVFLLQAIDRLLEDEPELEGTIEVHLAGVLAPADRAVAERSPVVRLHGYLSHAESLRLLRTADLLFLPMQDLPSGRRARIVPGKTYEYLASERPILAAVPDGDARDILRAAGNADLCRPKDVDAMTAALRAAIDRFRSQTPAPAPDPEVVARFEYGYLARELADVFERVLGRVPVAV